jgi:hypothetical protein
LSVPASLFAKNADSEPVPGLHQVFLFEIICINGRWYSQVYTTSSPCPLNWCRLFDYSHNCSFVVIAAFFLSLLGPMYMAWISEMGAATTRWCKYTLF